MRKKTRCDEAMIACPFFRSHTRQAIGCEGITDECSIKLNFVSNAARDRHEAVFCMKRYHYCEIYRAVYQKYDDMEGD